MGEEQGTPLVLMNLALFIVYPVFLLIGLSVRSEKSHRLMLDMKRDKHASTSYTIDILSNFYLLADYSKRVSAVDKFEHKVDAYNLSMAQHEAAITNNKFI